ncbi:helix-turn-helix domain-containing protein [Paracoccus rhizosphaerae]|uniref:Helix-turn-helix domain-containing protein n=1 Tax=Paracoccus rhizosphaerae TaxID=1133347 RepID=A0ABV6CIM8_9RHOB|nr:helix-turn-helix domain-containing protein [Paracoccus rhizosphaerae]
MSSLATAAHATPSNVVLSWRTPSKAMHKTSGSALITRRIGKNETIFSEDDRALHVYRVISGAVRTSRFLTDGRRQIDEFYFDDDVFGLEGGDEHRCTAEAVEDTVIAVYPRNIFVSPSAEDAATSGQLVAALARSLTRAREHMLLLGCKTAIEKIAAFLLGLSERLRSDVLCLPMTRLDIADHLGLTIETVSRSLTQLERAGLIEAMSGRRSIVLRDVKGLRQLDA